MPEVIRRTFYFPAETSSDPQNVPVVEPFTFVRARDASVHVMAFREGAGICQALDHNLSAGITAGVTSVIAGKG